MTTEEMIALCKKHTMYSWAATDAVTPLPIERAEGVWLWTPDGRRLIDWNSQLMCVNIGHGHPRVRDAIVSQLDKLAFAYPGTATEIRARVGKLLSEIVPGDIHTFFFTLGGAEANESAIKAARLVTGRFKILARYRSYHGGTNAALQLTGDPRRLPNEPGMPGVIHVFDPVPYRFSFGETDEERTRRNLEYLEEVITYEGPSEIAAIFIEAVPGSNGILPPPAGYLAGLRALLDRHGILLVCDEVMSGFGRTGRLFAFEHGGIVPDIVTMAKGLTSSYIPLGAMGVSDAIAAHFRKSVFWGGLTYNSHPVALAAAEAAIRVLLDEGMVENAARLDPVMRAEMARLAERHPSVGEGRNVGLFGAFDIVRNPAGELLAPYGGSHPALAEMNRWLLDHGLFTFIRWSTVMCNPPLCITEAELRAGFAILDQALDIADRAFEA